MDGCMDGWTDGWMDSWTDGWMDSWMHGWMDAWMDGWMDGWVLHEQDNGAILAAPQKGNAAVMKQRKKS